MKTIILIYTLHRLLLVISVSETAVERKKERSWGLGEAALVDTLDKEKILLMQIRNYLVLVILVILIKDQYD